MRKRPWSSPLGAIDTARPFTSLPQLILSGFGFSGPFAAVSACQPTNAKSSITIGNINFMVMVPPNHRLNGLLHSQIGCCHTEDELSSSPVLLSCHFLSVIRSLHAPV